MILIGATNASAEFDNSRSVPVDLGDGFNRHGDAWRDYRIVAEQ